MDTVVYIIVTGLLAYALMKLFTFAMNKMSFFDSWSSQTKNYVGIGAGVALLYIFKDFFQTNVVGPISSTITSMFS